MELLLRMLLVALLFELTIVLKYDVVCIEFYLYGLDSYVSSESTADCS